MKKIVTLILLNLLFACNSTQKTNVVVEKKTLLVDVTPKVTGIGGIFFFSDNPKETREWYAKNLGF